MFYWWMHNTVIKWGRGDFGGIFLSPLCCMSISVSSFKWNQAGLNTTVPMKLDRRCHGEEASQRRQLIQNGFIITAESERRRRSSWVHPQTTQNFKVNRSESQIVLSVSSAPPRSACSADVRGGLVLPAWCWCLLFILSDQSASNAACCWKFKHF